jgi:hypothetical protein
VPLLVLSASLATRRWGSRIGGLLTGLPIVSGPALFFFAVEQGAAFAAEASRAVLMSLLGVAASALTYGWASLRAPWWLSLPVSWASFFVVVLLVQGVSWPATLAFVAALAAIVLAHRLLPRAGTERTGVRPAWDLPVRMVSAMILVVSVTGLAHRLGPTLSGALAPFPVAISVVQPRAAGLVGRDHVPARLPAGDVGLRGVLPRAEPDDRAAGHARRVRPRDRVRARHPGRGAVGDAAAAHIMGAADAS